MARRDMPPWLWSNDDISKIVTRSWGLWGGSSCVSCVSCHASQPISSVFNWAEMASCGAPRGAMRVPPRHPGRDTVLLGDAMLATPYYSTNNNSFEYNTYNTNLARHFARICGHIPFYAQDRNSLCLPKRSVS